ncbi:hypothetical protein GCM10010353_55530 [Streptomyces chryseus]|nr:hypothetical protein GCM10010353_55530 [Streptomyces chryseus]
MVTSNAHPPTISSAGSARTNRETALPPPRPAAAPPSFPTSGLLLAAHPAADRTAPSPGWPQPRRAAIGGRPNGGRGSSPDTTKARISSEIRAFVFSSGDRI